MGQQPDLYGPTCKKCNAKDGHRFLSSATGRTREVGGEIMLERVTVVVSHAQQNTSKSKGVTINNCAGTADTAWTVPGNPGCRVTLLRGHTPTNQ